AQSRELLGVGRCVTGFGVVCSELHLVHGAVRVREAVRGGGLGKVVELTGVGVEAALVGSDAGGQKEAPFSGQQLLLSEETEILDLRTLFGDLNIGPRGNVLLACREIPARNARDVELSLSVLQAERGCGRDSAT